MKYCVIFDSARGFDQVVQTGTPLERANSAVVTRFR
jgi:hypothetical protein